MQTRTLIFDLDGTIQDPSIGIANSANFALRHFDYETVDMQRITPCIGPPLEEVFLSLVGELPITPMLLIPGIPLLDAADLMSARKFLSQRATVGVFLSSIEITSYARYLVHDPQSPIAAITVSTPLSHSSKISLFSLVSN